MHTIIITTCFLEKCCEDEFALIPYLIANSTFWRIGSDGDHVVLNEWQAGPLKNPHLKWWFKLLMKKRGAAAFHVLLIHPDDDKDIYLQLIEKIPAEPRYLCYGDMIKYCETKIPGGVACDLPASESVLKLEDEVFEEWRKQKSDKTGDTYYVDKAGAVGRNASTGI